MRYSVSSVPPARGRPRPKRSYGKRLGLAVLAGLLLITGLHFGVGHALPSSDTIHSGVSSDCLDVFHSGTANGTVVDLWGCNGTDAQAWTTTDTTIRHDGDRCVALDASDAVVLQDCSGGADQVWLREQQAYYNPQTDRCLAASNGAGKQLTAAGCNLSAPDQTWRTGAGSQSPACGGSEGDKVACEAVKQWGAWQAAGSNHGALLTTYTDGTPYEEWCADFVSYIYRQAGYPFTDGSADGWDENDATQIQNMGFTQHAAGSGYVPKVGDVAYFDYPGGHVEIVVSGGRTPTFVYGDSATIDPTTGNGQMKANTITQDSNGQVEYYLTPTG